MKPQLVLIASLAILTLAVVAQETGPSKVYEPFTPQEVSEMTHDIQNDRIQDFEDEVQVPEPTHEHGKPHKRSHTYEAGLDKYESDHGDLTAEEHKARKEERRRYHHMFKWGMIIGTGVLAFILCKFCIAKRRRGQQVRRQMMNQQGQMRNQQIQMQSPHLMQHQAYPVNQHAFPTHPQHIYPAHPAHPQQVQMGRPQAPQPQERQPVPQAVRGRPHDSCMRQPQAQNQHVDAQINYHENEIMRLKEMIRREEPQLMRREEPQQMRREMPINTSESLESSHPMARRPIPVGQPLYERDPSSFSSEYPEI